MSDIVVENVDDVVEPVAVKPVRKRRVKTVVAPADSVSDSDLVDRIRDGGWREVLGEVGSVKYNELRLLA
jgi:hypothetical protein